ncbi:hypothetical protein DFQ28_006001 [Apophysomyces sp. BC1034]|nr:hypothetical protein DFQ30_000106 [Apophysomyces sp. BC1015]KAG0182410.1 hypothetical protein DFQ29_004213 [Apophysomyces sp. BC1021]KAG0193220.1 hypothetical protein DFQ28_006001 [Apophysomyces sp. BC1034]
MEPNDRTRCHSMLNDGWWLDEKHTKWQPAGCMMHTYKPAEISTCLDHSRILYIGDSITRTQFFSTVQLIQKDIDTSGPKHSDRQYEFRNERLVFEFWWDPYLNSSRTIDLLAATNPVRQPSLLVVGTGPWYMRYTGEDYFELWRDAVDRVFQAVKRSSRLADAVILSPVEVPQLEKLSEERARTMTMEKVQKMNSYLKANENDGQPRASFAIPFVWNAVADEVDDTADGLHYGTSVTSMQTQLALNFRCNDQLPKKFPMDTTCCYHYPIPKWYQNFFFVFFLLWVPIGCYMVGSESISKSVTSLFPSQSVLHALFIFGLGVIYMYFGDRTQLFAKVQKQFDPIAFGALMAVLLVAGILTLKVKKEGDQGFLNRHQTDEWKGWMQLIILVYHFLGASGTAGIYNSVRILVAAYLFQTGYGHFFFFYKKADFGLGRIMNVMVRLNLLTFVLQYLMDTDYLSYYFTPLVSFWFLIIWLTMYVGNQANKTSWFILAKIAIACAVTGTIIHYPGILEYVFDGLGYLFNIRWNATEWRFRLGLDAWIVYAGMLTAYAYIKFSEFKLNEHPLWPRTKKIGVLLSVFALTWYFWYELSCADKFEYNATHPYISWVPILAFIVLRNATLWLRNSSSQFFAFIGRISLETFIGQFHMWLAGDTKGLLVVITDPTWAHGFGWWLNLIVSSALFIFTCHHLSQTTTELTRWLCASQPRHQPARAEYQELPLLPTSTQNDHGKENGVATHEVDTSIQPGSSSQSDDNTHEDEEFEQPQQPSALRRCVNLLMVDTRVKVLLFILGMGVVNRYC